MSINNYFMILMSRNNYFMILMSRSLCYNVAKKAQMIMFKNPGNEWSHCSTESSRYIKTLTQMVQQWSTTDPKWEQEGNQNQPKWNQDESQNCPTSNERCAPYFREQEGSHKYAQMIPNGIKECQNELTLVQNDAKRMLKFCLGRSPFRPLYRDTVFEPNIAKMKPKDTKTAPTDSKIVPKRLRLKPAGQGPAFPGAGRPLLFTGTELAEAFCFLLLYSVQ